MARIIQTQEQTEALKSVKNDLKILKSVNDFIEQTSVSETDSIIFSANINSLTVKIPLDKKTVTELMAKQKQKLQKDISYNASRFYIMLDDIDKAILER